MKYSHSILKNFIFPTLYTTITCTIFGSIFSTFLSISNSALDYEPLRQISSLFGIYGINFIFILTSTIIANCIINSSFIIKKKSYIIFIIIIILFIICSFNYQSDSFYQKDIEIEIQESPTIPVSCVFGQLIMKNTYQWKTIWYSVLNRVQAGDKIIMMSEESLRIETDDDERYIIKLAQAIANQAKSSKNDDNNNNNSNENNNNDDVDDGDYDDNYQPVFIGISYLKKTKQYNSMGTNHFTLISSTNMKYNSSSSLSSVDVEELIASSTIIEQGDYVKDYSKNHHNSYYHFLHQYNNQIDKNKSYTKEININKNKSNDNSNKNNDNSDDIEDVIWNYRKSHPVPFIESNIIPGPLILPTYSSTYGMLGGAICFDLDYPNFIIQSGWKYVDILLQPSWTWGAINYRHFDDNSIRTIENGFTLFRCSSDGESGIINHKGKILARKYTGNNPDLKSIALFSLPIKTKTDNNNNDNNNNNLHYKKLHTFYLVIGFMFQWLCLGSSILFYIICFISKENLQIILNKYFKISIKNYINNILAINDNDGYRNNSNINSNNNDTHNVREDGMEMVQN